MIVTWILVGCLSLNTLASATFYGVQTVGSGQSIHFPAVVTTSRRSLVRSSLPYYRQYVAQGGQLPVVEVYQRQPQGLQGQQQLGSQQQQQPGLQQQQQQGLQQQQQHGLQQQQQYYAIKSGTKGGVVESIKTVVPGTPLPQSPVLQHAIQSRRTIEYVPYTPAQQSLLPAQVIQVDHVTAPVKFLFRSQSGPVLLQQQYVQRAPEALVQLTRSEDPVQQLSHEVYKPIVHELREVIQPFRKVTQEIKPIVEEVRTVVAKSDSLPVVVVGQQQVEQQVEQQQQLGEDELVPAVKGQGGSSSSQQQQQQQQQEQQHQQTQPLDQKGESLSEQ